MSVSVCITCYNKEEWLAECVDSVLRQSRKPDEIIVVHDGCKKPGHYVGCLTLMQPYNIGVAKARDVGVKASMCDHLLFVDADDVLSPDYIQKMEMLDADIAYPDLFLWFEHGKYKGVNRLKIAPPVTAKTITTFKSIIPVTSLMKRSVYETLGGFKQMEVFEDWEFFLRAMAHGYEFKKAETILWYRQANNTRNRIDLEERSRVYQRLVAQYTIKGNRLCRK